MTDKSVNLYMRLMTNDVMAAT